MNNKLKYLFLNILSNFNTKCENQSQDIYNFQDNNIFDILEDYRKQTLSLSIKTANFIEIKNEHIEKYLKEQNDITYKLLISEKEEAIKIKNEISVLNETINLTQINFKNNENFPKETKDHCLNFFSEILQGLKIAKKNLIPYC